MRLGALLGRDRAPRLEARISLFFRQASEAAAARPGVVDSGSSDQFLSSACPQEVEPSQDPRVGQHVEQ